MKKIILMIVVLILVAGLTSTVKSQTQYQAKVTTTASAEIVSAVSLTNDVQLNFGKMSSPNAAVDVILSTGNNVTTNNSSAISLFPGTTSNSRYTVIGANGYNYSITLPVNDFVSIKDGTNSMFVNDFKARVASKSNSDGLTGTLTTGSDTFVVGATLKVNSGQASGTYSGTFDVIVTYN